MTDLDSLPFDYDTPATVTVASRHKHRYARLVAGLPWPARCLHCALVTEDPDAYFLPPDWDDEMISYWAQCPGHPQGRHVLDPRQQCSCGHVRDDAASRRGRLNRQRGNAQERDWCHRLAMKRVGHYGGPEDGIATNGMFVGQAKSFATGRFPTWMANELAKLPRSEGRIPILGILETPGPARDHRPRRLVVMDEADFIALHVGAGGER